MKLLDCWADHFHSLGKSQSIHNTVLQTSERNVNEYMSASIERCNNIIDSDLSVEEVEHAIHSLKSGRSGGFDGLSPEDLKFTCVMSKVFEIILKERISPVLDDVGIPQVTQTAYRKGVGCQDSIFAGKESTDLFIQGGDNVLTCFYDLASAFDTVEFSILLEELFRVGLQGKCWRLIHNWHLGLTSQVSLGKKLSQSFSISRGIRLWLCAFPNSLQLSAGSIALKPQTKATRPEHQRALSWCFCPRRRHKN